MSTDWKHLKSGTDIRGVAWDDDASRPMELTPEVVTAVARAFGTWLLRRSDVPADALRVALGRDCRLSGERMRDNVITALTGLGIHVMDCGLATTPAMFMTTVNAGAHAAIMLTASHHPYYRNGLKFFLPQGGLEGSDIAAILALCEAGDYAEKAAQPAPVTRVDYMPQYAAHLRQLIIDGVGSGSKPLAGFHIIVDAGNGCGGFYATEVLAPLGANTAGSQFLKPDGWFPNHMPNPEDEAAMASVCAATTAAGADLGVIFDTDVDRAGCVGADGAEINRNRLIAVASAIVLHDDPGGTIVTDSVTSDGLKTFIEQLGGHHWRFKRGYKNVINEAIRLNSEGVSAPLAIETSGHAALRENYFLDDGAYLVTKIIITAARLRRQGKTIEQLIASLPMPAEEMALRFAINEADFTAYGTQVLRDLEAYTAANGGVIAPDSREGVRISFGAADGDGWALLRLSVHDPVMPLNIESVQAGGCRRIAERLAPFIASCRGLNTADFDRYLSAK